MKMREKDVNRHFTDLAAMAHMTLPSKLSFAISFNLEKLQNEAERIEKERTKLCGRYADKDENDQPVMTDSIIEGKKVQEYKMSEENQKLFAEEYNSVLETEIEMEIRTVKTDVIERCETAERYDIPTVAQLHALSFMLEE